MNNKSDLTREELREKLRYKIKNKRAPKVTVMPKQYNQVINHLTTELNKIDKELIVSDTMTELYNEVVALYGNNIPNPKELLSNSELAKKEFNSYLNKLISKCKEKNIDNYTFRLYLNSKYTEYYIEVLGFDIIPQSLQEFIIYC